MDDNELRHRISRLIEREVRDYLGVETEWVPLMRLMRGDNTDVMQFVFPPTSATPVFEITVKEIRHDGN